MTAEEESPRRRGPRGGRGQRPSGGDDLDVDDAAAERTMLGWVRTGIQLMALGFMLSRFEILLAAGRFHMPTPPGLRLTSPLVGAVVIGQGAVVCVVAAIRYLRAHRSIQRGEARTPDLAGPMAMAGGIVAMGAVVAVLVWNITSLGAR
jgi:putative membrane protein